jgi:DNA-binding response OmpR family regulator
MRGPILAGRSILVVEDEPLIALDIEIALRRVGAKVLSTAYLWVGLHFAKHPGLSAAVLDLRLGLDDCTAICRRLSKLRVPFIFHSGYGGAAANELWPNAPVLSKPANAERIVKAVVSTLPKARSRRAVKRRGSRAVIGVLTH